VTTQSTKQAETSVLAYLKAMEERRLEEARTHVAENVAMVFPGGRQFGSVDEIAANSGSRYIRVQKRITGTESWQEDDCIKVIVTGTLYGVWKDWRAFEDIRFIDKFELMNGRIVRQEVWNDAAETLIAETRAQAPQGTH
jgi:hypothetical protein